MNRLERYFRVKEDYFMDRILDATDFMQDYSHPLTHSIVQQTDPMPFSVGHKKFNILFQYHISTTTPFIWMASDQWGMVPRVTGCHSMEQGNYGNKKSSFYQFIFILMVRQSITHWLWIELTHTQDHIPYSTHVRLLLLGDHHFVCFPWRFLYQNRFIGRRGHQPINEPKRVFPAHSLRILSIKAHSLC